MSRRAHRNGRVVLVDSNPLFSFVKAEGLDFIRDNMLGALKSVPEIALEVDQRGREMELDVTTLTEWFRTSAIPLLEMNTHDKFVSNEIQKSLGGLGKNRGESDLVARSQRNDALIWTDDLGAQAQAIANGRQFISTVGMLLAVARHTHRPDLAWQAATMLAEIEPELLSGMTEDRFLHLYNEPGWTLSPEEGMVDNRVPGLPVVSAEAMARFQEGAVEISPVLAAAEADQVFYPDADTWLFLVNYESYASGFINHGPASCHDASHVRVPDLGSGEGCDKR